MYKSEIYYSNPFHQPVDAKFQSNKCLGSTPVKWFDSEIFDKLIVWVGGYTGQLTPPLTFNVKNQPVPLLLKNQPVSCLSTFSCPLLPNWRSILKVAAQSREHRKDTSGSGPN